jgi:Ca2+-binding RTX toxin-like protein
MGVLFGTPGDDTIDDWDADYDGGPVDLINQIYGYAGADDLTASILFLGGYNAPNDGVNEIYGGGGDDRISALVFIDDEFNPEEGDTAGDLRNTISGGDGNDVIRAEIDTAFSDADLPGYTYAMGGDGDDRLWSKLTGSGNSSLFGGEGNDRLAARGGTDNLLVGNQGEDRLYGSSGEDRMIGGIGDDFLRGRGGADEFVFMGLREADRDRIFDFHIGEDKVDLSAVDANKFMSGNQAFQFSDGWHGTGRVWAEDVGKTTTLLHVDNGRVEMTIALLDGADVHADDYGASDFLL